MVPRVCVTFAPAGSTVWVQPGSTLADAAKVAGVLFATPCAGRGVCGGCGVRVLSGALEPADEIESAALARAPEGVRLACRARVAGAVEVRPLFAAAASAAEPRGTASGSPHTAGLAVDLVAGVDLGTTSVSALLVVAGSGREVARFTVANRQQTSGADVLSRVSAALAGESSALQALAQQSIRGALDGALRAADASADCLTRVVVAGNSAMAALLAGDDVSSLSAHPFTPPNLGGPLEAGVGEALGTQSETVLVPPIAAFVGGDALAATVAAGLIDTDVPRMLVDIGTNAEIVLALPGELLVSSTAAGPAFEGAGVSCGGPAGAAAVDHVAIWGSAVVLHTIGDAQPEWLSGAGLVSALAALKSAGHLRADGQLDAEGPLSDRFARDADGVLGVVLSQPGAPVVRLSQLDVRALQLAKAAVRVGIESLLAHACLSAGQLAEVLVAGAFGTALEPTDLVAIGVLPSASASKTRRVGNAALEGAALMALDPQLLELARSSAATAHHVDLASEEAFGSAFLAATEFAPYDG